MNFCTISIATAGLYRTPDRMRTYHEILEAAIHHLEQLKNQGVRFVSISPGTLGALASADVIRRPSVRVAQPVPVAIQSATPIPSPKPPTETSGVNETPVPTTPNPEPQT